MIPHTETKQITQAELIALYCERQDSTHLGLLQILEAQHDKYHCIGHMLLECAVMDGSRLGEFTILPFGPNNTYKTIPDHPVSPRGLASDMSVVKAYCLYED
jgi:hypothetical protein